MLLNAILIVISLAPLLFFVSSTQAASSSTSNMVRFEQLQSIPEGWRVSGVPLPSQRFQLRIALHQQNVAQFEQTLLDLSTPSHPQYGKHLQRDAVKAMLRPTDETINGVLEWLKMEGIHDFMHDSDWIHINLTIDQAEKILDTKFLWYQNMVNGGERIRTLGYSIPERLRGHIDMIQPTTRFGQVRAERSTILRSESGHMENANKVSKWKTAVDSSFDYASCNASRIPKVPTVTPECIRHLYNFGNFQSSYNPVKNGAKFGICGYLDEYAKYDDLTTFLQEYAPYAAGGNFSVTSINGGRNDQNDTDLDSLEANLDVQWGVSLAYPVPVEYYTTGGLGESVPDLNQPSGQNSNEPYLDFLHYMMSLPDDQLPQTLSTSYGEDEQTVPEPYARSTCNLFAQLGARGVSVLFSSGDSGTGAGCMTNDGTNTTRFLPLFPAGCPFVTAVGATFGVFPEQAVYFSGGGFSELWPRPAYQDESVKTYLGILGTQWQGLYNPNGRGIPDVSAQGLHLHLIDRSKETVVSGTSASTPIFSSIIALLNSARMDKGLTPLGFLNPWLYSMGKAALTDIVDGGSTGCTANDTRNDKPTPFIPFASWNATPGWDPVTGLGTPNFQKLLDSAIPTQKHY